MKLPLSLAAALLIAVQPLAAQSFVRSAAAPRSAPRAAAPAVLPMGLTPSAPSLALPSLTPALPTAVLPQAAAAPTPSTSLKASAAQAASVAGPAALAASAVLAAPAPLSLSNAAAESADARPSTPVRQGASRARFSLRRWAAALMLGLALVNPAAVVAKDATLALQPSRPAVALMVAQAEAPVRVEQGTVLQARDLQDALARFNTSNRVVVIGDVGLGQAELERLARSLSGKHWTVVLVQDASGLRYTDAEGRTHYDDDAVDFATAQGLYEKEGVLDQVNPTTGERDGAILTFVMGQNILFLRTADAYNTRGLDGDTKFKGNLDRWAVQAMRSSGDIVGAVDGTVRNVTALLEQKIAAEQADAKAAVASAKTLASSLEREGAAFRAKHPQAYAALRWPDAGTLRSAAAKADKLLADGQARAALEAVSGPVSTAQNALSRAASFEQDHSRAQAAAAEARAAVDAADRSAAAFRESRPKAAGDLARPAVDAWRSELKAAESLSTTDPAAAAAAAGSVLSRARSHADAMAAFEGGADRLKAAEARLTALAEHPYASAAPQEVVAARQALASADEAYADGSAEYVSRLEAAKSSLSAGESAVEVAAAEAASKRMWTWIFIALANLLTLGGAFWLNRRSARFGAKAEELFGSWDTALDKKLEAVIDGLDEKMDTYVGAESGPKARGWVGKSAELSAAIRLNAGTAKILLSAAQNIHDQVRALVHPKTLSWGWFVNLLWPSRYQAAVRRLQDEPIEFKPADGVEAVLGAKRTWQEDLYGDLKAYAPFKKSFNEVIAAFNERSQAAAADLARLEEAVTGHGPKLAAVESALSSAKTAWDALQAAGAADGLFLLPSVGAAALPAASAALARARETVKKDPVGGLDGDGALGSRIAQDAAALAAWAAGLRPTVLAGSRAAAAALSGAGIASDWLGKAEAKLSGAAEAAAAKLEDKDAATRLAVLKASGEQLHRNAFEAGRIQKELAALRADGVAKVTSSVDAARATVGAALNLDAAKMLREKNSDPTDRLATAAERADQTAAYLGQGELAKADGSLKAGNALVSEAAAIVAGTLASLAKHEETLAARRAETTGLETLAPQRAVLLDEIKRRFADSVLSLGAGDASHPNGNGTVEDNPAEARADMDAAAQKTDKAVTAFKAGRLLEAASLLGQADAHQNAALHRLDEVKDKLDRLNAAVAANAAALTGLDGTRTEYDREVAGDARTMNPTLAAYASALTALEGARKAVKAAQGDPFKAAAALAETTAQLQKVWVATRNDRDAHAEAGRSLEAARRALDSAGDVARQAANDQVADSPAITAAFRQLETLTRQASEADRAYRTSHGDWNAVDRAADAVTAAAAQAAATLRGEIEAGQRAVSSISSAASKVREATNWSGSHGVYISGSPGSGELDAARSALSNGDYDSAQRHAESAYRRAASAISEAEAEESRRRREEEERRRREREERDRREREERERRERSSDSGGGSSGGGGSSWGGSSSGNGRSGW